MRVIPSALLAAFLTACATTPAARPITVAPPHLTPVPIPAQDTANRFPPGSGAVSLPNADPFPSTYAAPITRPTLIRNATIMTAAGPTLTGASILLRAGKIVAMGASVDAPADALVVDGTGKFVTPGMIDTHSHLGVYAAPGVAALSGRVAMPS